METREELRDHTGPFGRQGEGTVVRSTPVVYISVQPQSTLSIYNIAK